MEKERERREEMLNLIKRFMLAGVGALALTKDEVDEFLDRLVERGELAEDEARRALKEAIERQERKAQKAVEKLGVEEKVETVSKKADIPRKSDIVALAERIEEISRKLDALSARIREQEKPE
jgi:poly(hydroxyalkanoate) granule-associated protein